MQIEPRYIADTIRRSRNTRHVMMGTRAGMSLRARANDILAVSPNYSQTAAASVCFSSVDTVQPVRNHGLHALQPRPIALKQLFSLETTSNIQYCRDSTLERLEQLRLQLSKNPAVHEAFICTSSASPSKTVSTPNHANTAMTARTSVSTLHA